VLSMQLAVACVQPRPVTPSWPHANPIAARRAQISPAGRQIVPWRYAAAPSASTCMAPRAAVVAPAPRLYRAASRT
jgi:hypothetical protein